MQLVPLLLLLVTYGCAQLIVLPTNLEYVKSSDLRLIADSIQRLKNDFVTLGAQIAAVGKDGFERMLDNFQENFARITAATSNQRNMLLYNKISGKVEPKLPFRYTASSISKNIYAKMNRVIAAPPVVISNRVPTQYTFHSQRTTNNSNNTSSKLN